MDFVLFLQSSLEFEPVRLRGFAQGLANDKELWRRIRQAGKALAQPPNCTQNVEDGEHYRVLRIKQTASDKEIKAAFRRLARQYHPDVNQEDGAGDSFKSIRLAYEVLSNSASRTAYDELLSKKTCFANKHGSGPKSESHHYYGGPGRYEYRVHYRKPGYRPMEWGERVYYGSQSYASRSKMAYQKNNAEAENEFSYRNSFHAQSYECKDWALEWRTLCREVMQLLWVVAFVWHVLGVQSALTVIVLAMCFKRELSAAYKVAYAVSWLIGEARGLILACVLSATSRLFGNVHGTAAAISVLALWLGGPVRRFIPLPSGAIVLLAFKCIQLDSDLP